MTDISAELRPSVARYVFGSIISWPVYVSLIAIFYGGPGMRYLPTASLPWFASYTLVNAIQKRGTFGRDKRMLLEMLLYAEFVIALSGVVNFELLHVFEAYTSISQIIAATCAAVVAAGIGFAMSRIVLDRKVFEWLMRKPTIRFITASALGFGINFALLYVFIEFAGWRT